MHSNGLTDRELLARFVTEGDQDAFAQIVHRHGALVYGICLRFCATAHDAEDAAQSVFASLARRARTLEARNCLASWLHVTANYTARRWRRSADTRRRHEYQAGSMRPDFIQGEDGLNDSESLEQLRRALGALPEDYRNALILHHFEGYTIAQVAELLATPPGTIAARLSRGRSMLRQRLALMGLILAEPEIEELLCGPCKAPDAVPLSLREANYCVPTPCAALKPLALSAAVGTGAVSTFALPTKTKAMIIIAGLFFTSGAAAVSVCAHKAPPPPASVALAPPPPEDGMDEPIGVTGTLPEPSALSLVAPLSLLLLKRPQSRRAR